MGQEVAMRLGSYGVARMSRVSGGHWEFRSSRCGQEAMGSGDLIQEVQEVVVISGAQGVAKGLWGQET